ncbi:MAG: hypothetical protein MK226_02345 [Saprospiraceae bacterium]|nr:hypothetical protein [Saprospiraceae bacterium]
MKILQIHNLHKRYGCIHTVNNLSLEIEKSMINNILGTNERSRTIILGMILDSIHLSYDLDLFSIYRRKGYDFLSG